MNYNKKEIIRLSQLHNIPTSTLLNQQKNGKQAVDAIVIKKIVADRGVTLEQFLELFEENPIAKRLEEIEKEPYSSSSPLSLALLEIENENGLFIDDTLFSNRKKIEKIRKKWWSA